MIALLTMAGCAWISEEDLAGLRDGDGDDVPVWEDCDDEVDTIGAAGPRFEDADGDGVGGVAIVDCPDVGAATGGDCDDADAAVGLPLDWYPDVDGDGSPGMTGAVTACDAPDATYGVGLGDDCDDADANIHPGAVEDCENEVDDDCDTRTDECDLRAAGTALHYGAEAGGVGAFPSLLFGSPGALELVIARPYAQYVDAYAGAELPRSGEVLLGDPDWFVRGGPVTLGSDLAAGDLDADSFMDLVVGAADESVQAEPYPPDPQVALLHGPVGDADSTVDALLRGESGYSKFGQTLAVDDLDGDGIDDLAVGATEEGLGCGIVFVAFGEETFPESGDINGYYSSSPTLRGLKLYAPCEDADGAQLGGLGSALVAVPAGREEERPGLLAIGDPNAGEGTGAVYVWRYGTVPTERPREFDLAGSEDVTIWTGVEGGGLAGVSLAAGDLDGDGSADLAIGVQYGGDDDVGAAYVVYEVATNLLGGSLNSADVQVRGELNADGSPASFGFSVAVVRDIDGDGYDELAVSAPYRDGRAEGSGAVYLFDGRLAEVEEAAEADVRLYGAYAGENAGWTLEAGGDLDADGKDELVVGAPGWSPDGADPIGAVVVLWGADR